MKWMIVPALALAACGVPPQNDAAANDAPANLAANAADPNANCTFPRLDFSAADELSADERDRFTGNLRAAFERACREGLFAERPLVDPRSYDRSLLSVMNAPQANGTSIYFGPSAAPPAMLLESPFGSPAQIPTADELHEAIYCEMRGATPEEEQRDGRCLPD